MLRTRVITALIALPIVAGAIYLGGIWFFGGAVIIALIAGWEYVHMLKAGGYQPALFLVLALIALLIVDSFYPSMRLLSLILSLGLLGGLTWQLFQQTTHPTADWALTLAGGLYIGWGIGHIVALRELADGMSWLWLALLATWASDTFAYFVGRAIGQHRLWPRHSPKKTWEGLGGGIAGSMVVAALVALVAPGLNWTSALVIGAIIPIAGLFGDLSISMMKRNVGVKDSSNLFPGHGGFLDRIDSLLFVGVVVYYFAIWIG